MHQRQEFVRRHLPNWLLHVLLKNHEHPEVLSLTINKKKKRLTEAVYHCVTSPLLLITLWKMRILIVTEKHESILVFLFNIRLQQLNSPWKLLSESLLPHVQYIFNRTQTNTADRSDKYTLCLYKATLLFMCAEWSLALPGWNNCAPAASRRHTDVSQAPTNTSSIVPPHICKSDATPYHLRCWLFHI